MRFTTVALVVGVVAGLAGGGRLGNLGLRAFRAGPFLAAGLLLRVAPGHGTALALSYLCLLVFALANLRITGMGLITVGLALNALVVTANGRMPVRGTERPEDRLTFLDDRIPVDPLGEILSFGDLVLAVGLVTATQSVVRKPPEGRHAQLAEESGRPRLR